jgi:hypothetical protein
MIANVRGGSGVDTILGNTANNLFLGNAGADGLHSREGNDIIPGGAERDTLVGEAGADPDPRCARTSHNGNSRKFVRRALVVPTSYRRLGYSCIVKWNNR